MSYAIQSPYSFFNDRDGSPLNGGYLYFGVTGLSAETNPTTVYWDEALTIPAFQPIRTRNGLPYNNGTPAIIWAVGDVSITVKNSQSVTVFSSLNNASTYAQLSDFAESGGSNLIGHLASGTGATVTTVGAKLRQIVNVADFGAVGNGVTDDTAAIQAAIDYMETLNGGVVEVPQGQFKITSTIQINGGLGVQLIGQGSDGVHDAGTGAGAGTIFLWYGSAGAAMLHISSPSGVANSRQWGSSVSDIYFNCRTIAGIGVLLTSVRNVTCSRLFILSPTIAALKTTTLGNAFLAESSDVQQCVFDRILWRCIDNATTRAAHGLWLTSHNPISSDSNTSFNLFSQCIGQNWGASGSGYGLFVEDADNNTFTSLRIFRVGGLTVEAVRLVGNPACDANHFWNLSAGGSLSVAIKGIPSGYTANPNGNSFWATDVTNGTQYPTADVGVIFGWHTDNNTFTKQMFNQQFIADSDAAAIANLQSLANESQYIYNAASNHIRMMDGIGNLWGINIDGVTGDFRILRLTGTGSVDVGNGSPVKISGKLVSQGAADSGGVGFKVLRVPN